jgi:hypothetical protein
LYTDGARVQDLQYENRAKNSGDKANGAITLPNKQIVKKGQLIHCTGGQDGRRQSQEQSCYMENGTNRYKAMSS